MYMYFKNQTLIPPPPVYSKLKKIKDLAEKNLPSLGQWEIAQVPEPIFNQQDKNRSNPILNLMVHRESYFIFNTYVCSSKEVNSAAKTLIEAIEEHKIIPEILLVREKIILKELEPIAHALGFKIVYPARLKAAPSALRDMRRLFRNRD